MSDIKAPGSDQTKTVTHGTSVGAGPLLYDPNLYLLAAQLDAVEDLRKATENRFRQATRSTADKDGETRGLGLPENDPAVKYTATMLDDLAALEHRTILELQRAVRRHPLGGWQKRQVGVGEKQLARLLASIGDPYWHVLHNRPRTVSELWAYCGLHTLPVPNQGTSDTQVLRDRDGGGADRAPDHDPGDTQERSVRGAARRRKGERANWSTDAKTRAYLIAESCSKQRSSPYREVYDKRRAATAEKVHDRPCPQCNGAGKTGLITSPWRPGHQHADALRLASKAILRDLWVASREWYRDHE